MMTMESIEQIMLNRINFYRGRMKQCEEDLEESVSKRNWPEAMEAMLYREQNESSADALRIALNEIRREVEGASK